MQLPELNFEDTFDFQIKRDKDKFFIYDLVRKTWLLLTPEEWVRQHWVHYFHLKKGRNLSSLILEKKLELNGTTKRIDLLVTEKTIPKVLVECKAQRRFSIFVLVSDALFMKDLKRLNFKIDRFIVKESSF